MKGHYSFFLLKTNSVWCSSRVCGWSHSLFELLLVTTPNVPQGAILCTILFGIVTCYYYRWFFSVMKGHYSFFLLNSNNIWCSSRVCGWSQILFKLLLVTTTNIHICGWFFQIWKEIIHSFFWTQLVFGVPQGPAVDLIPVWYYSLWLLQILTFANDFSLMMLRYQKAMGLSSLSTY